MVMQAGVETGARGDDAVVSLLQRSSTGATSASSGSGPVAPPIIDQVLARPGQPLPNTTRRLFETRFRRDFSDVRLHTDSQAGASAAAVDAHAYTVGTHIVFGSSRYAPHTNAGRRLLAHELAHVVQQGAALRRASISPPVEGEGHSDDEEEKQPVQRLRRSPAIVGLDEAGPGADLTGKQETQMYQLAERDKKLAECKKAASPDPVLCDPATPPDWSQFTAAPVAASSFDGETFSFIKTVDVPSQKCEEQITGYASGPTKRFQGVFDGSKSWVKPAFRDAADPTKNGSAAEISKCESQFDTWAAAGKTGWWALGTAVGARCPASVPARGDRATNKGECATVVGKDFNDRAVAESMRLLKHEQTHLALTCAMAKKGNDLLAGGASFASIDAVIRTKLSTAQSLYDTQTNHGCIASQQAAWESAIASGLPAIKLP
ncbi:MAG: DUF4157 domain-containing protein [Proteobacteria bacterium]|nr:DUF4157 domain-containing protein [Pseudomonadota bacterium]